MNKPLALFILPINILCYHGRHLDLFSELANCNCGIKYLKVQQPLELGVR